jgi:Uma2 family endonuclease
MADNTLQWEWIVTIKIELEDIFWERPDVFIASDLLWYPIQGNNKVSIAPDVMVVFGRPKGHRGCYKQWEEGAIAPQVVFEILSPNNTALEMSRKLSAYEQFGPEEYYLYDPDSGHIEGWIRKGDRLVPIEKMNGWMSPRLGIRFEKQHDLLRLYRPDGSPFETSVETRAARRELRARADASVAEAQLLARQRDEERRHAREEQERAENERERAERAERENEALKARLRELGIHPETVA